MQLTRTFCCVCSDQDTSCKITNCRELVKAEPKIAAKSKGKDNKTVAVAPLFASQTFTLVDLWIISLTSSSKSAMNTLKFCQLSLGVTTLAVLGLATLGPVPAVAAPYQVGDVAPPGNGSGVKNALDNSYGKQDPSLYPAPSSQLWPSPYIDNQPAGNELLWANLYALPDNKATKASVQTRDMELWGLRKSDHKWVVLQTSNSRDPGIWEGNVNYGFNGGRYDYPTVITYYGVLKLKIKNRIASFNPKGNEEVEHWWPTNKPENPWASFNPSDYEGYYARAEMRLDPNQEVKNASYVAQIGVDQHLGHGRWNKLTSKWQTFSITTLEPNKLRKYPPPLKKN